MYDWPRKASMSLNSERGSDTRCDFRLHCSGVCLDGGVFLHLANLCLKSGCLFFFNFVHSLSLIYPVSKGNVPHNWQNLKAGSNGMNSSCGKVSTLPWGKSFEGGKVERGS